MRGISSALQPGGILYRDVAQSGSAHGWGENSQWLFARQSAGQAMLVSRSCGVAGRDREVPQPLWNYRVWYNKRVIGVWRSLVARTPGGREVIGSNPVTPTKFDEFTDTERQEAMTEQVVNSNRPVIVVDIDGVLFDTPKHAVERWNKTHATTYTLKDIFDYNAQHNKELFRHWHKDGIETNKSTGAKFDDGFYGAQKDVVNYLIMPGAIEVLTKLKREYGASLHALTARDKDNLGDVTSTALSEHFGIGELENHLIEEVRPELIRV